MRRIWINTKILMSAVRKAGGKIAIEWPGGCKYWHWKEVTEVLQLYGIQYSYCNGCALGLKVASHPKCKQENAGTFVYKPWLIATDDADIHKTLNAYRCPGKSELHKHEPCAGKYTKATEGYSNKMVRSIHNAWKRSCVSRGCVTLPAGPTYPSASSEEGMEMVDRQVNDLDEEPFQSIQGGEFTPLRSGSGEKEQIYDFYISESLLLYQLE